MWSSYVLLLVCGWVELMMLLKTLTMFANSILYNHIYHPTIWYFVKVCGCLILCIMAMGSMYVHDVGKAFRSCKRDSPLHHNQNHWSSCYWNDWYAIHPPLIYSCIAFLVKLCYHMLFSFNWRTFCLNQRIVVVMMSTNLVDVWEVPQSLDYIPTFLLLFIFSVLSSWQSWWEHGVLKCSGCKVIGATCSRRSRRVSF